MTTQTGANQNNELLSKHWFCWRRLDGLYSLRQGLLTNVHSYSRLHKAQGRVREKFEFQKGIVLQKWRLFAKQIG